MEELITGSAKHLTECQSVDDAALIATILGEMECTAVVFNNVASNFGLAFSFCEANLMAIGTGLCDSDKTLEVTEDSQTEHVHVLSYVDLHIDSSGRSSLDISIYIAANLKEMVLFDKPYSRMHSFRSTASITSRFAFHHRYYGGECWVPLQQDPCQLLSFHNHCVCLIE